MKTLESVKNDVFASFADAQMSKEEMKMVRGGDEKPHRCKVLDCWRDDSGWFMVEVLDLNANIQYIQRVYYAEVIGSTHST